MSLRKKDDWDEALEEADDHDRYAPTPPLPRLPQGYDYGMAYPITRKILKLGRKVVDNKN